MHRYTAPGGTVIDRNGTRDRMEVWNVSRQAIPGTIATVSHAISTLSSGKTI